MQKNNTEILFVITSKGYIYKIFYLFFIALSWILSHLRFADKDKSNDMTKHECRKLFTDSLNVELPEEILEKLFKVIEIHSYYFLSFDLRKQIKLVKVPLIQMNL